MKKRNNKTTKSSKTKSNIRFLMVAFALAGTCSVLFYGVSSSVLAMELGKKETVPTAYTISSNQTRSTAADKKEEAKTVDYHLIADELAGNDEPGKNELNMEEAAQIGVDMIERLFDLNSENTYVYMSYCVGTETFPRAFWSGDIRLTDAVRRPEDKSYHFSIDAVTGEYFDGSKSRNIEEQVSLGLDASLEKDSSEFEKLAREFVEAKKLLQTSVAKVEYHCQGYTDNDPEIVFLAYGENGERVNVSFSRYDKDFKGFISESSLTILEKADEEFQKDVTSWIEAEGEKGSNTPSEEIIELDITQ